MTIYQNINRLVAYALKTGLITRQDIVYTQNRLLEFFALDGFESEKDAGTIPNVKVSDLENILSELISYGAEKKLFSNESVVHRDLFDTKIMGLLVPPPSDVIDIFNTLYSERSPKEATDWFYKFSQDTDYIRRYRICRDKKWKTQTKYGKLDITINLSKPEKDPKAIAAARNATQSGYPKCLLCPENEGYAGRLNHPARQNHRIIPLTLNGETWGFQYSPYVYYNEHCIVFNTKHTPMKICHQTFCRLLDFVTQFPHYTLGSNADLPIVGGSILTHDHFQGGNYEFPMARAPLETEFKLSKFRDVKAGIVKWPMSVIRLDSKNKESLIAAADFILAAWRKYSDKAAFIFAKTDGENHNTITPIVRRRDDLYELDLVLRNNITTEEHPLGVYHPHAELHHIKKENIGLIEVMGLAVLPSRLKKELELLAEAIVKKADIAHDEVLAKHAEWVNGFMPQYFAKAKKPLTKDDVAKILEKETGLVFSQVLEHAGVYKNTPEGREAFMRFIEKIK
ncbi:UDP-glucose--hexose-1-phosphate uridylyltransferase [Treponema sp.]|uniref:UDP-glucose--hexose-1-phosphate uridylyltransferase n=1 Tax=Treponema sp. TaxID=166 RepID=UPI00298EB348|nr:UDP-glucose--hexose-1-phosphate uridylyltransferase [Treponema sp.]MCR5612854.1 UDP-glucose--hexose-1-phosphate uridylyltransferase [Treponema sp.]